MSAVLAGSLMVMLACSGETDESQSTTAAEVEQETREAMETAGDYAATQRAELASKALQARRDLDAAIQDASQRLSEVPDQAKAELETAIEDAKQARDSLGEQIDGLKQQGSARWETTRERLMSALDEVEEARREIGSALRGEAG